MKVVDTPVIIEEVFPVTKEELWEAITKRDKMIQWFFENIPDFKAEEGFTTKFDLNTGERIFPHVWEIIEVVPQKKIVYKWTYDGYKGVANVTFDIIEMNGSLKLVLTNKVIEDFSDNIPEFTRESCIGGWNFSYMID